MSLEPMEPTEAVELYLEDKESELAAASLYGHSSRLGHFVRWCQKEGISNLNKLSGRDLHEYRLWRRRDGDLAPITEKTQMDTLRVFMRWGATIDAVPADLYTKVVSPSMSDEKDSKDVKLDAEIAKATLDYLSTYEYASDRHVTLQLMWRALLRRGAVHALDVGDYDPDERSLHVEHRPESETPIKNKEKGERYIALSEETCEILNAWLGDQRTALTDEYDREPFLTSEKGRVHQTTIANYIYSVTTPCLISDDCPHDREITECNAANVRTGASTCPSSHSPHAVRRGAITHWLESDVPEKVVSDRANVSSEVLDKHYDRRSERQKMEQRRDYLDQI